MQIEEVERYPEWMQIVSFHSNRVGIAVRLIVSGVSAGVVEVMELSLSSQLQLEPHLLVFCTYSYCLYGLFVAFIAYCGSPNGWILVDCCL